MPIAATRARSSRIQLPRFLPDSGGMAAANGNDSDQDGGIPFPNVVFSQQAGPFVVPLNGPFPVDTGQGTMFFDQLLMSGYFQSKFVNIPNDPNQSTCNMLTPPAPTGVSQSAYAGPIVYNPLTGLRTGSIAVIVTDEGILPSAGGNAPVLVPVRTGTAADEAAALALTAQLGGYVVADTVTTSYSPGSGFQRIYVAGRTSAGYFVNGFMNMTACPSGVIVGYLYAYSLVANPTVFGAPARTQHITGYDAGTQTYAGNASKITVQFVAPGTTASYLFTWLVTPDNGDPPYRINQAALLTVVPGVPQTVALEFPPVTAATVYLENWDVLFNPESSDDFESYPAGLTMALAASGAWPFAPQFGLGGTWDDFENFTAGTNINVASLSTGYWPYPASISSVDQSSAYDGFEDYAAGALSVLNRGTGWLTVGSCVVNFTYQAYDDFEAYPAGAIVTLPLSPDNFNRWPAAGSFGIYTDPKAFDDFESYAVGPILSLPVPGDPANHWSAPGTFGF